MRTTSAEVSRQGPHQDHLLDDLATLTLDEVILPASPDHPFTMTVKPTTNLSKALELLGIGRL